VNAQAVGRAEELRLLELRGSALRYWQTTTGLPVLARSRRPGHR
jgi:hypothetical protein